ncbi:hypothetical protein [Oryza sativa Japonica Group]|uniref:Uncharacterized protein n=1 Tax=Oryza sativa subsp. japonica TaxID=39947 RepID=Q8S199_ORYSJ|nr:hypothetical protein [Oryza sativa Japonica Group]BAD73534.1 hypothetical protein [Oryza sativa Japonica Group]
MEHEHRLAAGGRRLAAGGWRGIVSDPDGDRYVRDPGERVCYAEADRFGLVLVVARCHGPWQLAYLGSKPNNICYNMGSSHQSIKSKNLGPVRESRRLYWFLLCTYSSSPVVGAKP